MQQTQEQLNSMIRSSFENAYARVHARNQVKQLVGMMAKYFPHVSHNQVLSMRDIAMNSLSKAILATDYQPIPVQESWTLHKHGKRGDTISTLQKENGEHSCAPEVVVSYCDIEAGMETYAGDIEQEYWSQSGADVVKNVEEFIRDFDIVGKVYKTGGHVPTASVDVLLASVAAYLHAINNTNIKIHTDIFGNGIEISTILLKVEDTLNNLFVEIRFRNLA